MPRASLQRVEHAAGVVLIRCIASALAAMALASPMPADAACQIRTLELPVKMVGSRAVATVGVNGTPVPLTVDSGAPFSFLTEAAAAQLQLRANLSPGPRVEGLNGSVDTYMTTVDKLQLLKGEIPNVEFIVGGNEPGAGTMGLLGRNLLAFTDTEYDLAHGVIRFSFPDDGCDDAGMAYWSGASPVTEIDLLQEYRAKLPALRAHVKLNGVDLVALFDTGATTVVTTRAAKRAGVVEADMVPGGTMYGAGRGSSRFWMARFDRFEIGGEAILNNRLAVTNFNVPGVDLLLGIDFFLSHRIYVSKKRSKMFFTYNGGAVFALDKAVAASAVPFDVDPAASGTQTATADQFASRGAAAAARHDYEGALADLDRSCALEPTSAAFFAQRGAIQVALKHSAKALEDFDRAVELDPTQADALWQRASLRFSSRNASGATVDLDALDKMIAPQAQMRLQMSRLYLQLELPEQALAQLNRWLPAHPHEIGRDSALKDRCWIRLLLNIELDQALDDCDEAVGSHPKNPVYLACRGWAYLRLGKYGKALTDFDRSIEYQPKSAWSLYGRGMTKTRLGDTAQGEVDFEAARELLPDIGLIVAHAGLATPPTPHP